MEKQDSAFSEFFRNASDEEKKRVYTLVAEKATQRQLEIIEESKKMTIDEREAELNQWFENGDITQKEWAKLWQESLEDL